jgi:hypothetical protein
VGVVTEPLPIGSPVEMIVGMFPFKNRQVFKRQIAIGSGKARTIIVPIAAEASPPALRSVPFKITRFRYLTRVSVSGS